MAVQFHPLPLSVFPKDAQPFVARFNREVADLFGLEGTIRNPDSTKKSDNSIARQSGPTVAITRITPSVSTVAGSTAAANVTTGTPALTLGTVNTAGTTSTVISINSSIALFDVTVPAAVSTSSSVGSVAKAARRDHTHSFSFDQFAPTTTAGDIMYNNGATNVRLAGPSGTTRFVMGYSNSAPAWELITQERSILVESPTASEDLTIFHTPEKIQVTEIRGVLRGGSVTTVTVDVKWDSDRTSGGTSLLNAPFAVTGMTTGDVLTLGSTVGNLQIPASSYVWLKTSSGGGTGTLHISVKHQRIF